MTSEADPEDSSLLVLEQKLQWLWLWRDQGFKSETHMLNIHGSGGGTLSSVSVLTDICSLTMVTVSVLLQSILKMEPNARGGKTFTLLLKRTLMGLLLHWLGHK